MPTSLAAEMAAFPAIPGFIYLFGAASRLSLLKGEGRVRVCFWSSRDGGDPSPQSSPLLRKGRGESSPPSSFIFAEAKLQDFFWISHAPRSGPLIVQLPAALDQSRAFSESVS